MGMEVILQIVCSVYYVITIQSQAILLFSEKLSSGGLESAIFKLLFL